jgi:rhamnosyltransferase
MHKLPWKSVGASNHSPVRRYYMTRNQLVLAREYLWKEPVWTVSTLYAHLKSTIAVCFLEQDILRKLQYTALGIVDGLRSNFSRQLGS